ncbi:MAG TPA: hypothetical protein VNM36_01910 [Gemmatimonadaceae bacterium]|nr:hypothetical protein [Gemmatimonadaceae bacterium]
MSRSVRTPTTLREPSSASTGVHPIPWYRIISAACQIGSDGNTHMGSRVIISLANIIPPS